MDHYLDNPDCWAYRRAYAERNYPVGTRIRLLAMPDDPNPIPAGTCGTVWRWMTPASCSCSGTTGAACRWCPAQTALRCWSAPDTGMPPRTLPTEKETPDEFGF